MPPAFRRFKPPVRSPRENKVLRTAPTVVDPELQRQQRIYDILRAFADRAFRRPATHDELTRLLEDGDLCRKGWRDAGSAIRLALRAVLASPHFLFIGFEPDQGPDSPVGTLP